jgi:hypothetical protein
MEKKGGRQLLWVLARAEAFVAFVCGAEQTAVIQPEPYALCHVAANCIRENTLQIVDNFFIKTKQLSSMLFAS